jgi:hypothetical protein
LKDRRWRVGEESLDRGLLGGGEERCVGCAPKSTLTCGLGLCPLVRLEGSGDDRIGGSSAEEKMGWMLEERPVGELDREYEGGGVADMTRGEGWFEGDADNAGDDGRGDWCSLTGLGAFNDDCR